MIMRVTRSRVAAAADKVVVLVHDDGYILRIESFRATYFFLLSLSPLYIHNNKPASCVMDNLKEIEKN